MPQLREHFDQVRRLVNDQAARDRRHNVSDQISGVETSDEFYEKRFVCGSRVSPQRRQNEVANGNEQQNYNRYSVAYWRDDFSQQKIRVGPVEVLLWRAHHCELG